MAIKFACPYCEKISSVPDSFAGKKGKCPACQKVIEVPDPGAHPGAGDAAPISSRPSRSAREEPSSSGDDTQECRYCGETIKRIAKKCKFCGEFLDKRLKSSRGARGPKPDNHLVIAIISTVVCGCLPLGIMSIVNAAQVDSKYNQGDYRGAQAASRRAKSFAMWSFGVYFAFVGLYIVLAVVANL